MTNLSVTNPSLRETLALPATICGVMLLVAVTTSASAGVDGSGLFLSYFPIALAVSLFAVLAWALLRVAALARVRADRPLARIGAEFYARVPLLILPCLVWPLFLAAFTTAKTSIPFLVGFGWDRFWTDADHLIFRLDPWIITHAAIGPQVSQWLAFVYTAVWGLVLAFTMILVPLFADRSTVLRLYGTMLLTWLVGGWAVAFGFSAAGPVFAHLFDPALDLRFADLRQSITALLPHDSMIVRTQAYLAGAVESTVAVKGGGISAMPSMHLGVCSVLVLIARRTPWFGPALMLWAVIFIGSVHFGYHYAVDGFVAAGVAALCWLATNRAMARAKEPASEAPQPAQAF